MAIFGVSITKNTNFRGTQQSFSNVYYLDGGAVVGNTAQELVTELTRIEKQMHSSSVNFKEGRVWSAGGTAAENEMLLTTPLTGQGGLGGDPNVDRERAVLIQWPAGVNVLGRPVYLRKWYHTQSSIGTTTLWADQVKAQTAPIAGDIRSDFQTIVLQLNPVNLGSEGFYNLISRTGRGTDGDGVCYPWLEHHQLGDEWRT